MAGSSLAIDIQFTCTSKCSNGCPNAQSMAWLWRHDFVKQITFLCVFYFFRLLYFWFSVISALTFASILVICHCIDNKEVQHGCFSLRIAGRVHTKTYQNGCPCTMMYRESLKEGDKVKTSEMITRLRRRFHYTCIILKSL